jgi:hypothetical protein
MTPEQRVGEGAARRWRDQAGSWHCISGADLDLDGGSLEAMEDVRNIDISCRGDVAYRGPSVAQHRGSKLSEW